MEESPFKNKPITYDLLRDEVYPRVNADRTRAYGAYLEESVARPSEFKELGLKLIRQVFDASAHWFLFIFDNRANGEHNYDELLKSFVTEVMKIANELIVGWHIAHKPQEFISDAETILQARRSHWNGEYLSRATELRKRSENSPQLSASDYEAVMAEGRRALERWHRSLTESKQDPVISPSLSSEAPASAETHATSPNKTKHEKPLFPRRATWLKERLTERGWNRNQPRKFGGPDPKTLDKILAGGEVREDVLEKLAIALSKKRGKVDITSIPSD
jgi:hypothetical protein